MGGRRPAPQGRGHQRRADRRAPVRQRGARLSEAPCGPRAAATAPGLALLLAYEGTAYHGWQVQPDRPTVQGLIATALRPLLGGDVRVVGASRTDAGVHALGQVASVLSIAEGRWRPPETVRAMLNATLPPDVRVLAAREVPVGFDARRSARLKRYGYLIATGAIRSPFLRGRAWHLPGPLDVGALRKALAPLRGRHDFSAFQAAAGRDRTPVCHVRALRIVAREEWVAILVSADAFLHHMVRNLVGTAVEVGRGRQPVTWPAAVLATRDRRCGGSTAPADGLYLLGVRYPAALFPGGRHLGGRVGGRSRWG